jgi:hypothetical protein
MNKQIKDFVDTNEIKILNRLGKTIAERAVALLDEYIKKMTEMIVEHSANGFEIPDNQPMLQKDFQALVRSIIRGEAVNVDVNSLAITVAKNQINKAAEEYIAILEKE